MSKINQMFDYEGKTTKVVGNSKTQIYKKLFDIFQKNKIVKNFLIIAITQVIMNQLKIYMKKNIFLKI